MDLKILPPDCDRAKVIPLMDKALSPYVKGGGAKKYEAELKRMYNMEDGTIQRPRRGVPGDDPGFAHRAQRHPVQHPGPYFALLGRAVVTLEGIALIGNPDYKLVMEAYPFVARSSYARTAWRRSERSRRCSTPPPSAGAPSSRAGGSR